MTLIRNHLLREGHVLNRDGRHYTILGLRETYHVLVFVVQRTGSGEEPELLELRANDLAVLVNST